MRKRAWLLTVLVLSLAVAWAGLAAPAGAGPNDPSLLFGARPEPGTQQGTTALEGKIGRRLAAVRVYENWDSPWPDANLTWFVGNGYTPVLSVKSERVNHTFVQWRDIANAQPGSTLYNDIVRWASRVKSLGTHVYFTFNHEPETSLNSSGLGADFIAACSPRARPSRASSSPNGPPPRTPPSPTARPSGSPTPAPSSRSPAGSPSRASSTTTSPPSTPTAAGWSTPARPPWPPSRPWPTTSTTPGTSPDHS